MLLLVLLALGPLAALAPAAQAQGAPFLCFDRDAQGACSPTNQPPPDYLEGDRVGIELRNMPSGTLIRVQCLTGCLAPLSTQKEYYARWTQDPNTPGVDLTYFPDAFNGIDGGANAIADRAPQYNSTWRASALLPGGTEVSRTFDVWAGTFFASRNQTVAPGEAHLLRTAGHERGTSLDMRVERRTASGTWVDVFVASNARANDRGLYETTWTLPKTEAGRILECGLNVTGCYRLRIHGAGKQDETIPIRVGPATLVPGIFGREGTDPNGQSVSIARTANATVAIDWHYPAGHNRAEGPKLVPEDLPLSPVTGGREIRVAVEQVDPSGRVTLVDTVPMRYEASRFRWEAVWNVPRDAQLSNGTLLYRMRVLEARDNWGNRVPEMVLGNYTVVAATLKVSRHSGFTELPRAEDLNFTYDIQYLDGSPLKPEHLPRPLVGCFHRSPTTPPNCAGLVTAEARNESGRWAFHTQVPLDYGELSAHRLYVPGAQDLWGNSFPSFSEAPYTVIPGSPHVDFQTIMRGRATEELERGNSISVQAVIKYGDGTPLNRTLMPDGIDVLEGTLIRRGPNDVIITQERFPLTLRDSEQGRWIGELNLGRDDETTPLGRWTFRFDVRDNITPPNQNDSVRLIGFDRAVLAAPVRLEPTIQPAGNPSTGDTIRFRFRLLYEDGRTLTGDNVDGGVTGRVYRYGSANRTAYGAPLSGNIVPTYNSVTREFTLEYVIPNQLFTGTYVLVVSGGDSSGNRLQQDAYSRAFTTTAEARVRGVLNEPPEAVRRGESATVVFDAMEGDVGPLGSGRVQIQLQRFDATLSAWVVEVRDARSQDSTLADHVGVFGVLTTTPVGIYRFALLGRDATFHPLEAHSRNFTIEPTDVARALFVPPPEKVTKGETFTFTVEAQAGDRITESFVLYNGRTQRGFPLPVMTPQGDHVDVTWKIPFEVAPGNYSIRLTGRDAYGNHIEVVTPAIEAQATTLVSKILGNPARVVNRGETVNFLFGITYSDGQFYLSPEIPRVTIQNASGIVASATVRRESLSFAASWSVPSDAGPGDYFFEVGGQATGGNTFSAVRSSTFRLGPGTINRYASYELPQEIHRLDTVTFAVPIVAEDKFVGFTLEYYGATNDASGAIFGSRPPQSETPLLHTLNAEENRYDARFATDLQTPPGLYRILMKGEDRYGNTVTSKSNPFLVKTTAIGVQWDRFPSSAEFVEGGQLKLSFVTKYRNGPVMDEKLGQPSIVILYNDGRGPQPIRERPTLAYNGTGRWDVTWDIPDTLLPGDYTFSVGGNDIGGNAIANSPSIPYTYNPPLGESFLKVVPGIELPLALVGIALLAALLRHRARSG